MIRYAILGAGAIGHVMAKTVTMMNQAGNNGVKLCAIASRDVKGQKSLLPYMVLKKPALMKISTMTKILILSILQLLITSILNSQSAVLSPESMYCVKKLLQ